MAIFRGAEDEAQTLDPQLLVLGDQRVSSVMTSRKDVVAFNIGMTADEIKEELAAELHDSYPVFDSEREEVRGVV